MTARAGWDERGFNLASAEPAAFKARAYRRAGWSAKEIAGLFGMSVDEVGGLFGGTDSLPVEVAARVRAVPMPPVSPVERQGWRRRAACKGMDTALFDMSERGNVPAPADVLAVCAGCPVRLDCLEYAVGLPDCGGPCVFGGVARHARKLLKRDFRRLGRKVWREQMLDEWKVKV